MMQRPSAAEMEKAKLAFLYPDDVPKLPIVDRSTAERWGNCPWQAKALESGMGRIMPAIVQTGEEIHAAFGRVTRWYIEEANSIVTRRMIVDELLQEIQQARPDLQPDAIAGMKASIWSWADFLRNTAPENILGFDGGEEIGKSGQLSWEFNGFTLTCELDLLNATESPEVLDVTDYKTGFAIIGSEEVASSFQFAWQALAVLNNYPDVEAVRVRIWNTRTNNRSHRVLFRREHMQDLEGRIFGALKSRFEYGNLSSPPTWPTFEKCSMCQVAYACPAAEGPIADLATADGERAFVDQMVSLQAKLDSMGKLADSRVDAEKRELQGSAGARYGRAKPVREQKRPGALYAAK